MTATSRAEQEAGRVLQMARAEYGALGEPWNTYRIDVDLVASLLFNLGVQRADLRVGTREYAGFLDADAGLVAVEASHHEHRQRFSVAHEIGHFVLHVQPEPAASGLFRCTQGDMEVGAAVGASGERLLHLRRESEANLFAGAILMPEAAVGAMYRVTGGRVAQLAKHFDVSPQAMEIRLIRLGLKPH